MNPPTNPYRFEVSGNLAVRADLPVQRFTGDQDGVRAFLLPDGREVQPALCLKIVGEVEADFLTAERDMAALGFQRLSYQDCNLYPLGRPVAQNPEAPADRPAPPGLRPGRRDRAIRVDRGALSGRGRPADGLPPDHRLP